MGRLHDLASDFLKQEIRTVTVDGRPVCCRFVSPAKPGDEESTLRLPVLLLHGLGCSGAAWVPSLNYLRHECLNQFVFAPDMPGYGDSPGPREALGMDALADWAVRLMDALGVERAHLAGNSMGCQVALALARRHPARVGGIVLLGPTTGRRYVSALRYFLGLFLDGVHEPVVYNGTLVRMYFAMGVVRYFATAQKMLADDPFAAIDQVQSPCLVLRAKHDGIVPNPVAHRLARALPQSGFLRLDRGAHAMQFNRPAVFVPIAVSFWAGAEAGLGLKNAP